EGVLELSTTARSVLGGDLPLIDDRVTVEHLLSHRSGIGDYLDEESGWEPEDYVMPVPAHELVTTEDYLAVLDGHASKLAAGERSRTATAASPSSSSSESAGARGSPPRSSSAPTTSPAPPRGTSRSTANGGRTSSICRCEAAATAARGCSRSRYEARARSRSGRSSGLRLSPPPVRVFCRCGSRAAGLTVVTKRSRTEE